MPPFLNAAEKKGAPQPSQVVLGEVGKGMLAPQSDFTATVYYTEVSNIACELSGRVDKVSIEEGRLVKKGAQLIVLNSDLLQKTLKSKKATSRQVANELEKARKDLTRAENLYKEESIPEQFLDDQTFRVKGLENQAAAIEAEVEGLEVEMDKKTIKAPFSGIVLERSIERGEWCKEGTTAAVIAKNTVVDVIADVPEHIARHLVPGMKVDIRSAGKEMEGMIFALIPRGDLSTRSFPVKIRVKNSYKLAEGMEATVSLPSGEKMEALTVPRDAVISNRGKTVVFTEKESKAVMIPVSVIGYSGMDAGVTAKDLKEGMKVVVKGNERIRDGQDIAVAETE